MDSRKNASFALVLLLTASSFAALQPGEGQRAVPAVLTVREEWSAGPFASYPYLLVNDTDGDGRSELILWTTSGFGPGGRASGSQLWIYDLPAYSMAWSANFTDQIYVETVDLGQNGSVQLLLTRYGSEWTNCSVISGTDLSELWTSPDFYGSMYFSDIVDIDSDGQLEFLWMNQSMSGDKQNFTFSTRMHVYGAKSFQNEWESPNLGVVSEVRVDKTDADAARELLVMSYETTGNGTLYSLSVYDGDSHELQWRTAGDPGVTSMSILHVGEVDGDRGAEVVLYESEYNDSGGSSDGFQILSGSNGSAEWGQRFENASLSVELADIDNDTLPEMLATSMGSDRINTTFSFHVFDLKARSEVWRLGPFQMDMMGGGGFGAEDLTGDGVPELIIANNSMDLENGTSTFSFDVFDGKSLVQKWDSPDFAGYGFTPTALPLDSDAAWEVIIPESWADADSNLHGVVHVFSTDTYTEEWKSDDLGAGVDVRGEQAINDSRPELLITTSSYDPENETAGSRLHILDSDTHATVWTGPVLPYFGTLFADLYGSPSNEIVLMASEMDVMQRQQTAWVLVYNDTTFAEAWSSEKYEGSTGVLGAGDFDGDGKGELGLLTSRMDFKMDYSANISVFEFTEEVARMADLAIFSEDLALSNATPVAGTPVVLTAGVRNLGDADAAGCCITLAVDGISAGSRTVDISAGMTAEVNFTWRAAYGSHTLAVKANPKRLIPESDYGNNNASLSVSVGKPPRPVATISSPAEGQQFQEGENITFDGSQSYATPGSAYYWTSELSGYLGSTPLFNSTLPVGEHVITLYIDDGTYNVSDSVTVGVAPGPPPPGKTWAVISSPLTGSVFALDDSIRFDGSRSAPALPEHNLSYEWRSSLAGVIGDFAAFTRTLPAGAHNITLTVDDGHGGSSSASVSIKVREYAGVMAVISSPREGQAFDTSQPIRFDGSNSSGPAGSRLAYIWASSLAGPLSSDKVFSMRLSAGNHTVTLIVNDIQGKSSGASVNITVQRAENSPPTVNITYPAEGSVLRGIVNVTGSSWDDTGVEAVYISIDNGTWYTVSGTLNWSHVWNTSKVPNGTHRITVRATDGLLSSPEVTVNFSVDNPGAPPPPVTPAEAKKADNTMLYASIGIIIIVAAAGAAAFLFMRKR